MRVDMAALRAAHPLAAVVKAAGVVLRPSGRRLVGGCPLHADTAPSFTVYLDTDSFYCFGCGAGGDVVTFLSQLHQLSFRAAVRHLDAALVTGAPTEPLVRRSPRDAPSTVAVPPWLPGHHRPRPADGTPGQSTDAAGRGPSRPHGSPSGHSATPAPLDAATRAVIAAAVDEYHTRLWHSPVALAYLARRGVGPVQARDHRLGYATGTGLLARLRRLAINPAVAERVGLLRGGRECFTGRVIIPDLDAAGRPTWLSGRAVTAGGPRYLSLRRPAPLLGLHSVRGAVLVLVEGPFDWLTARGWGLPAVALLGTRAGRHGRRAGAVPAGLRRP